MAHVQGYGKRELWHFSDGPSFSTLNEKSEYDCKYQNWGGGRFYTTEQLSIRFWGFRELTGPDYLKPR